MIVLIGIGQYYMQAAFNNLVTLKSHADIKVSLITDKDSTMYLPASDLEMFDKIIYVSNETFGVRGYDVFKVKLHLDELTPYEKTLYIDADTCWNNDHSIIDFIKKLNGVSFTSANRGRINTSDVLRSRWVDLPILKELYGVETVYDLSSEVMYFEKTNVFERAREYYDDLRIPVKKFGDGFPDEVFLMLSIEDLKVKLHNDPWYPSYWQPNYFYDRIKAKPETEIRKFQAISLGGAWIPNNVHRLYYKFVDASYYKMSIPHQMYTIRFKSQMLKERTTI